MEPFGQAMAKALQDARVDPETGEGIWIEEDYCSPPLAMERAEVLTEYFTDLTVVDKNVRESDGWERIEDSPGLWNRVLDTVSNRSHSWVDISRHSDVCQTFEILTIFDSVEPSLRKRFISTHNTYPSLVAKAHSRRREPLSGRSHTLNCAWSRRPSHTCSWRRGRIVLARAIRIEHPDISCIVCIKRGSSGCLRIGDRLIPIGNRYFSSAGVIDTLV